MNIFYLSLIFLFLSACNSDQKPSIPLPQIEKPATKALAPQPQVNKIELDLQQTTMQKFSETDHDNVVMTTYTAVDNKSKKEPKVSVKGGVFLDKTATAPRDSVSGGEVKLNIPFH
jgi:hypothetical protein